MRERFRAWLLQVLRVPAEPAPPPGDPRLVQTFRAAPSYFRYSVAIWALQQLSALSALLFSYFFFREFVIPRGLGGDFGYFGLIEQLSILTFLAQLPFSFALIRLSFEMRWYILSDRSLRIRHGVLSVSEQTMTFANVQNIAIRQNPIQRLFGISTVVVRAAGGGSGQQKPGQQDSHEARFEGVDNADRIREVIRDRIRGQQDSGLGDPDDDGAVAVAAGGAGEVAVGPAFDGGTDRLSIESGRPLAPAIAAAHRVLAEATRLGASVG